MRLFTAIDLPGEMLEKLDAFLTRLRPLAKLRWTAVENLHITTKFIGEWPEARLDEMKTALRSVSQPEPIQIAVRGVGWFPDQRRPHVFWAGVNAGEPLARLAHTTEQAVSALGVPTESADGLAFSFDKRQRRMLAYGVPEFFQFSINRVLSQCRLKRCRIKEDVNVF